MLNLVKVFLEQRRQEPPSFACMLAALIRRTALITNVLTNVITF